MLIPSLKQLNDNPDEDFTETEIQLNKECEENKHLIGLPFYKKRVQVSLFRNAVTDTCKCKEHKRVCKFELKCRICYEKFKKQQKIDQNVEFSCNCKFYLNEKSAKRVKLIFKFCKISETYNCNDKSEDHVCDIKDIHYVEQKLSVLYHDDFIYYCRNPEMPRKSSESVADPEYCRHAAISFINMFAKVFAIHSFYAFEIIFGKIDPEKNSDIISIDH